MNTVKIKKSKEQTEDEERKAKQIKYEASGRKTQRKWRAIISYSSTLPGFFLPPLFWCTYNQQAVGEFNGSVHNNPVVIAHFFSLYQCVGVGD